MSAPPPGTRPGYTPDGRKIFGPTWTHEWSSCFDDGETCAISCFCPCVQFARNYVATVGPRGIPPEKAVEQDQGTAIGLCCLYTAAVYCCGPVPLICACMNRGTLREKYGIQQGDCASPGTDCAIHCCCHPCALTQEWRELQHRWDQHATQPGPQHQQMPPPGGAVATGQPVYSGPPGQMQMVVIPAHPVAYVQSPVPQQQVYVQQPQSVAYMAQPQPVTYVQQPQPVAYAQQPQQNYTQQSQPVAYAQQPPQ